jgi:eukaryotic-like serine/threonine-protein kinase
MNPRHWEAVGRLFDGALAVATGERQAWIEQASGGDAELRREVSSLLASHDAAPGGFVQEKIKKVLASFHETSLHPQQATVGAYRLVRELGRGGMGTVFLAERNDNEYRAQVAIKLVRPGMDTEFILTRFRRERQTLARMQHPNIARLLDGGTTAKGVPYIVMEYIDGPALTRYAKKRGLGIPERLRLFAGICSAVAYAHRNFVVHRDIKPGNILIGSDGIPKLLDFGICKLLRDDVSSLNDTTGVLLTPAYASPEQMSGGPVTPLSDIYSLGVVLYELLAAVLPRRDEARASPARAQAFGPGPVLQPSMVVQDRALARQLSGDLDNIVMRALESEPERRYQWAEQISDDLNRYLAREPVQARPQTRRYVASKFMRRNRVKLGALLAVLLALIAGLTVSVHEARVASARLQQLQTLATQASHPPAGDASLEVYRSMVKQQEGDALLVTGEFAAARQAYLESARGAESCMKLVQAACLLIYIQSSRGLAQSAVSLGRRQEAVEFAERALHAGDDVPADKSSGLVLPRAYAAMGATYAALWRSPLHAPGDHQQAQLWLAKSLTAWHEAQSESGFSAEDQREMNGVQDALLGIDR